MKKMKPNLSFYYKTILSVTLFVLIAAHVFSQNENTDISIRQFQQYQTDNFQEKLFVHTDKSFYLAGEQIWLKVYATDAFFHKPCRLSKVAYVELIDKNKTAVLQAKIALENASGNASLKIPASLISGNYLLRAYTSWMKNYSPEFYYEQNISIVNTLIESNKNTVSEIPKNAIDIQFFPEGGNMIAGISSKIAFKAINQFEDGVECKGSILNQKKDTVTKFESLKFGMGNFIFTPQKEDHYVVIIQTKDTAITKDFLPAKDAGYIMSVSESDNQDLQIVVESAGVLQDEMIYLLIHSGNSFKLVQSQKSLKGRTIFLAEKNKLGEGISHFTIFNSHMQPLCERLYFKAPQKKLAINISTSPEFLTRDSVSVSIATQNENGKNIQADLSMSVFFSDSLISGRENNDILSYLLLTSELKGKIESPGYYFDETVSNKKEQSEAIDNLMLTQGWSRFHWDEVLQSKTKKTAFFPETEGLLINGKVVEKKSGLPGEGIMTYLSVPGKNFKFCTSSSNESGEIIFNPGNFYQSNQIIVQTNNEVDSIYRINILDPFSDKFSSRKLSTLLVSNNYKNSLLIRSIASQSENAYHKNFTENFSSNTDTLAFYGKPDKRYNLDDYTRFTSMEEVMREYVTEIRLRQNDNKFHFNAWNSKYKTFNNNEPLVLMDGVPVFSTNKIIAFDPLKVKKMEIVTQNNYTGALISSGILSYSTYNGDLAGFPLDAGAFVLEYEGLQKQIEFYVPKYQNKEQKESKMPDLRNVLFWSPNTSTDISGHTIINFYTSDLKGKYTIVVQGISPDGVPGYSRIIFTTK